MLSLLASLLASVAMSGAPTIKVVPQQVHKGGTVRVSGAVPGCLRPGQVTLLSSAFSHTHSFASVPAVFAPLSARSAYSVLTRIPAKRKAGRYRITGRCGGGNLGVSASLRVVR